MMPSKRQSKLRPRFAVGERVQVIASYEQLRDFWVGGYERSHRDAVIAAILRFPFGKVTAATGGSGDSSERLRRYRVLIQIAGPGSNEQFEDNHWWYKSEHLKYPDPGQEEYL